MIDCCPAKNPSRLVAPTWAPYLSPSAARLLVSATSLRIPCILAQLGAIGARRGYDARIKHVHDHAGAGQHGGRAGPRHDRAPREKDTPRPPRPRGHKDRGGLPCRPAATTGCTGSAPRARRSASCSPTGARARPRSAPTRCSTSASATPASPPPTRCARRSSPRLTSRPWSCTATRPQPGPPPRARPSPARSTAASAHRTRRTTSTSPWGRPQPSTRASTPCATQVTR